MLDKKQRKYETFNDFLRDTGSIITNPVSRLLDRLGIHPNTVTFFGFLLNILAGFVIATGKNVVGGLLVIIASSVDGFDGALARMSGKQSRFGSFLDSTLDRLSEGALFFGLLVWFTLQRMTLETYLLYFVVLGSIMVSYARARAEGLGFECKVGIMTRLERMVVLSLGLLLNWLHPTLALMLVLTWITFFQRAMAVYKLSGGLVRD
jgi:CDP-diacylglycerol--glycerol-3-phosphate 3-phosphatidyltransferase